MNSRLFFPLIKQKGVWLSLILLFQVGAWCWLCDLWKQRPVEVFGLRLMLALSVGFGLLFSGIVYELLHTSVAPILPGLRQKLVVWLACLPASVALLVTALEAVLWGGVPVAPMFALAWMSEVICFLFERSRKESSLQLLVVFIYGVLFWRADWLLALMRSWPWFMTLAGTGVAGICLQVGLSRTQWRQRALTPRYSLWAFGGPSLSRQWHEAQNGQTKFSKPKAGPRWLEQKLGHDLWSWTRAAFYEGQLQPWSGLLAIGLMYISSIAAMIFSDHFMGDHRGEPLFLLEGLLGKMDAAHPGYLTITGAFGNDWLYLIVILTISWPFGLQKERGYPLSRGERAGITYRACLVTNGGYCVLLLLIKAAFVVGLTLMLDKSPAWPPVPWFVIDVLIIAVYIPLFQSLAVIFANKWGTKISGVFFMIISMAILLKVVGHMLPPAQLAIMFLLLALAAQAGQYFFLRRYFAQCDLVAAPR